MGPARPLGCRAWREAGRQTWKEEREPRPPNSATRRQPYCLIIGGGQGGIALGARLKQLGVPTIIVEKNERPGDSWRKRYKSLCLHDPVWYDHLPYMPFPENWPVFSPKDKIGDWLEMYTKVMELNYWALDRMQERAATTRRRKEWTVVVERDGKDDRAEAEATGARDRHVGQAEHPDIPGRRQLQGRAAAFQPASRAARTTPARRCVVIGSNNSAHDICAALWEAGADVTMMQRSSTDVIRSDPLMEIGLGELYSEQAVAGRHHHREGRSDLRLGALRGSCTQFQKPVYEQIREHDADFYERLEKAGFMLDFGEDESGLVMKYMRRGSGYYIDVGASELIVDGEIKLRAASTSRN